MSTTTGTMKLFKPQSADFVDVNGDVNNQMSTIDAFAYPLLNYRLTGFTWSAVPRESVLNSKRYSTWDNSVRANQPGAIDDPGNIDNAWITTVASQQPWNLVNSGLFVSPWIPNPVAPVYYRFVNSEAPGGPLILEFKGQVINTVGFVIVPALSVQNLFTSPFGSVKNFDAQVPCGQGGIVDSNHYQYNKITYDVASGFIRGCRVPCAGNAATQTNGNTGNYYSLDGFRMRVFDV